jgi:hypothetical protein
LGCCVEPVFRVFRDRAIDWGRVRSRSKYPPQMRVDSIRQNLADGANPPVLSRGFPPPSSLRRSFHRALPRHGKRRLRRLQLDGCPSSPAEASGEAPPLDTRADPPPPRAGCGPSAAALRSRQSESSDSDSRRAVGARAEARRAFQVDTTRGHGAMRSLQADAAQPLGSTSRRTSGSSVWGAGLPVWIRRVRGCGGQIPTSCATTLFVR